MTQSLKIKTPLPTLLAMASGSLFFYSCGSQHVDGRPENQAVSKVPISTDAEKNKIGAAQSATQKTISSESVPSELKVATVVPAGNIIIIASAPSPSATAFEIKPFEPADMFKAFQANCSGCHDQVLSLDFIKSSKQNLYNAMAIGTKIGKMPPKSNSFDKTSPGTDMLNWLVTLGAKPIFTPSPMPTATPKVTPTPTATPKPTATPTPTPIATATVSPVPNASPTSMASPSPAATATPAATILPLGANIVLENVVTPVPTLESSPAPSP